jgi:hypothetical protein
MKRISALLLGLVLFGLSGLDRPTAVLAQAPAQWRTLLDGTNMNQWTPIGAANWRVVDGTIQADNAMAGFLVSKESYGDFELRAEFWVSPDANSGIFIRCDDPAMPGAASCYEVNIFDTRPEPEYGTVAIVNVAAIENMPLAANKWNTYQIIAQGDHLTVILNGIITVDVRDSMHPSGPLTLQYGTGVVKFRRVEIREL